MWTLASGGRFHSAGRRSTRDIRVQSTLRYVLLSGSRYFHIRSRRSDSSHGLAGLISAAVPIGSSRGLRIAMTQTSRARRLQVLLNPASQSSPLVVFKIGGSLFDL